MMLMILSKLFGQPNPQDLLVNVGIIDVHIHTCFCYIECPGLGHKHSYLLSHPTGTSLCLLSVSSLGDFTEYKFLISQCV